MNLFKRILILVASIVALVLLVAAFSPSKYEVHKEVEIEMSSNLVFNYIKYLRNQDNFSVWALMDPNMKKDYNGTDGTVGFVSSWNSENKNVGRGEQEIMRIEEGKQIDFELRFYEPFESTDNAYMKTIPISDTKTKVVWGFNGKMPYPMNLMLYFMDMEEMLGGQLEDGLFNLKEILESQES